MRNTQNTQAMMRKEARGAATPMTSDLHSELPTTSPHITRGGSAAPTRQERGRRIVEGGGQVKRIDKHTYEVRSQTWSGRSYEVIHTEHGWLCSCPDSMEANQHCKHAYAVEISIRMRESVSDTITIPQVNPGACRKCGPDHVVLDGHKKLKRGNTQRYKCKKCGKRFTDNLGFENKRATPEQITTAVDLVFSGMTLRKTATSLCRMGVEVSHVTVLNWAEQYAELMERHFDTITPQVGEQWRTDEVYTKIRGERKYMFAMLDSETRFWLAKQVASHKGTDDVKPMFRKARDVAGKVPSILTSDGAANFAEAHKDEYAPKNYLWKDSIHQSHIHMSGDMNNNQMESFNGNTYRLREEPTRGLKKDDSAILSGLRMYHNFVRPHLGLPDHITPAEAAGIHIEGNDKWRTMIQAAALAKLHTDTGGA